MKFWKPRVPRIRLPSIPLPMVGDLILLVCGFAMLARALWMIYEPAMWGICGILLMWAGYPKGKGDAK